jgi:hypothetical protein
MGTIFAAMIVAEDSTSDCYDTCTYTPFHFLLSLEIPERCVRK